MSPTRAYLRIFCRGRAIIGVLFENGGNQWENRGFSWGFHADFMGFHEGLLKTIRLKHFNQRNGGLVSKDLGLASVLRATYGAL